MINVTERAKERLKSMLSSKVDNSQAALRLTHASEGQFGLYIDVEIPGDKVVKHKGKKVLVLNSEMASSLDGATLDVEFAPDGPELVMFYKTQR
jgi:Fe-S cluster assembly iron-binding protein IscA